MSDYVVSARKYRPDSFESLIGQDVIARTLKNSIARGKIAHAYLFCGPRGVGKTSTARIFAKAINCSNPGPDFEPCGECESCVSFREGRSYCIHELDAASNNGVEDIKTLLDQVQIPPQVGRYSVYIIDEVHMLSTSAFNAFLKTLEEPPAHAVFILATTEKHKVLPTILSRCQTYDFNRISVSDMVRNLRAIATKEGIRIDDEALHVIARKADGAMRDALTIFDQTVAFCGSDIKYEDVRRNLNVLDYEYSFRLVNAFLAADYKTALLTFDEILAKGFNALHFVLALSEHFRDLAVARTAGLDSLLDLPVSLKELYREQAARCSLKFIYDALAITTQCEAAYKAAVNPRLHIEFALMKLSFLAGVPETPAQASRDVQSAVSSPSGNADFTSSAAPSPGAASRDVRTAETLPSGECSPHVSGSPSNPTAPQDARDVREAEKSPLAGNASLTSAATPAPAAAAPENTETEVSRRAGEEVSEAFPVRGEDTRFTNLAPDGGPITVSSTESTESTEQAEPAAGRRRRAAGLSISGIVKEDNEKHAAPAAGSTEEAIPADDVILGKWPELVGRYTSRPRLANALANARLELSDGPDGSRLLTVTVTNEAQRKWIADNLLRDLSRTFCGILGCNKVVLAIEAAEVVEEEKIYLPGEQAKDLMSRNEEVKNLVIDLELDI